MKKIFTAGLSYRTASVAVREQLAVPESGQAAAAHDLRVRFDLSEVVVLWTCNRVEIYGVAFGEDPDPRALLQHLARMSFPSDTGLYFYHGKEAVQHLFSVVSGMDSMVLGETEITGQVKSAYEAARCAGLTGFRLNRLFQKALETAKQIRSTTSIGRRTASIGSVAVQHAQKVFGSSLQGSQVMIIGAGRMAEKCLHHLSKQGTGSLLVVNRSLERAHVLADAFDGVAVSFGDCLQSMVGADIVITSTGSPHVILDVEDIQGVMARRGGRPLLMIDIAVPRDVDPRANLIPGVYLHDIGSLEETINENISYRMKDMDVCWSIIRTKVGELQERMSVSVEMMAV